MHGEAQEALRLRIQSSVVTADYRGDVDVDFGQVEGHCGQAAVAKCRHDEDERCSILRCKSCAWICHGYNWSGMETDTECTVRQCKRHAPTPEAPRRKYSKTGPAESGGTLYCGQCDGELPEVSREES